MNVRTLTSAFALLALSACATAQNSATQRQLDVRILNNLIPPHTMTVYLVPRSGIEYNLGDVFGSGTHMLRYQGLGLQGEYQLVARISGSNQAVASSIIVLDRVRSIEWDLQRNYIQVTAVDD
jgi:hypothetical protein